VGFGLNDFGFEFRVLGCEMACVAALSSSVAAAAAVSSTVSSATRSSSVAASSSLSLRRSLIHGNKVALSSRRAGEYF